MTGTHLLHPHGREVNSAEWAAWREERIVLTALKGRATPQPARRFASRSGFDAKDRNASLRASPMTTDIGRISRLASEPLRLKRGTWGCKR